MTPAGEISAGYDLAALQAALQTKALGRSVHYMETMESTNSAAMTLAEAGSADGSIVLAEAQTAGRGRRGRVWHSPQGRHLFCSIIYRMDDRHSTWLSWIPLASALAAAEAIVQTARLPVLLKWPNDVLVSEKKIGGILCEKVGGQGQSVVVIGIGLNINCDHTDFPSDIDGLATSMKMEYGRSVNRTDVIAALLNRLEIRLDRLRLEGVSETLAAYVARSATIGEQVRIMLSESEYIEGLAESIGPDGCLRVRPQSVPSSEGDPTLIEVRSADVMCVRKLTAIS
jgi:BirA family biotin operon repressor/biotin-[acetyl-CoA-carboxylase] ligase